MSSVRLTRNTALPALIAALALLSPLAACESQFTLLAQPAASPVATGTVRALLAPGPAGTGVTIDNPAALPQAVREAQNLEIAIGGSTIPVTRNPGGYFTFTVPAALSAGLNPDINGNWKVVFVMNDTGSQIVTLSTGSPVQFSNPPVRTDVAGGAVVRGLDVKLTANTDASTDKYQFTWSYSTSGMAPWVPIPGQGKEVEWTPAQQGNYFIKVDAVDKATQQAYSTTTPSAIVFVTEDEDVITTTPASGSVNRGTAVSLVFNRPQGLPGTEFTYAWSVGPSLQGPWTLVQGQGATVQWLPTTPGTYFVKTEVSNRTTGEVNTFVSPNAAVFVNEGMPIVTANPNTALRGDRVGLTLNLPELAKGNVSWYFSRTGAGVGAQWTPINGVGRTNDFLVNESGTYSFRVDVPDANGTIKTFTTTDPVLNVNEGPTRLITSDPPNSVISRGGSVNLVLNARGVDEVNYRYIWYVSTNPVAGWMALPVESAKDLTKKIYNWRTETRVNLPFGGSTLVIQPAGSYFVRVDASEKNGANTYTFTSSAPVVTIEN